MKVEISDMMGWHLQQWCAEQIHAAVVSMQLRVSATPEEKRDHPAVYNSGMLYAIPQIRALLRSIKSPFDRRSFAHGIGYRFKALRQEHGTLVKWQEYKALVESYRASQQAA